MRMCVCVLADFEHRAPGVKCASCTTATLSGGVSCAHSPVSIASQQESWHPNEENSLLPRPCLCRIGIAGIGGSRSVAARFAIATSRASLVASSPLVAFRLLLALALGNGGAGGSRAAALLAALAASRMPPAASFPRGTCPACRASFSASNKILGLSLSIWDLVRAKPVPCRHIHMCSIPW